MKPVPMKFGEYVWHHNPQNISFECDRSVAAVSYTHLTLPTT
mgnify:CR=1 FL=1